MRNLDYDTPELGPCCICEKKKNVRNLLMLHRLAPLRGTGWGCLTCSLPRDGAMAILCDDCLIGYQAGTNKLRFVCYGNAYSGSRFPYDKLSDEPFDHNPAYHPELQAPAP